MLKLKLTKAEIEKLPADIQKEYKIEGDNGILDTDVAFEDVMPLKNAVQHEKDARKKATDRVKELETLNTDLTARAGSAGDLEKSWQKKVDETKTAYEDRIKKQEGQLRNILVDSVAKTLATEISTAPDLILPHILKRLTVEEVDGQHITRVLDAEGKPSAYSVNDLKKEFVENKLFSPIITASRASGGGATGGSGSPAGGKTLATMSEPEKVAWFRQDPAGFQAALAAQQAK